MTTTTIRKAHEIKTGDYAQIIRGCFYLVADARPMSASGSTYAIFYHVGPQIRCHRVDADAEIVTR